MKYFIYAIFLLSAQGWAGEVWQSDDIWVLAEASADPKTDYMTRSRVNAKIRLLRTKIQENALDKKVDQPTEWTVIKGSNSYTLDEFVASGKLCEFRGKHEWIRELTGYEGTTFAIMWYGCAGTPLRGDYKCSLCSKCRGKAKQEVTDWEP